MESKKGTRVPKSLELYSRAEEIIGGSVQLLSRHPRSFAFGVSPIYVDHAKGCRFWDVDGFEYIDLLAGVGTVHLGYAYDPVDQAAQEQIAKGTMYSVNSPLEIELAEMLVETVPCCEMVRYAKGGGDADAVAVRIARGYTGKDKILFCGYHGWHDWYISANLKEANLDEHLLPGVPSRGVPKALAGTAIPFRYNDLDQLRATFEANKGEVAAVMMEACRGQLPHDGYLEGVKRLCEENGALLIFDEVVTGFRLAMGGAQEYFGVVPDMATFGKAIGNGYPLAAVVGRKEVMQCVSEMFISSSFWSDPISLAAGVAIQKIMRAEPVIEHLWRMGERFRDGMLEVAKDYALPLEFHGLAPITHSAFHPEKPEDARPLTTLYIQEMSKRGVYCAGANYIMYTLGPDDVDQVIAAFADAAPMMKDALDKGKIMERLEVPVATSPFQRRLV
jgi:glutamate-1-semialdehyde 2,1-aminomutase